MVLLTSDTLQGTKSEELGIVEIFMSGMILNAHHRPRPMLSFSFDGRIDFFFFKFSASVFFFVCTDFFF